jgi:hypothetical protein
MGGVYQAPVGLFAYESIRWEVASVCELFQWVECPEGE